MLAETHSRLTCFLYDTSLQNLQLQELNQNKNPRSHQQIWKSVFYFSLLNVLFSSITNSYIAHSSSTIEEVRYSTKAFYLIYILVIHVYTTSVYCIQGISTRKNAVQAAYSIRADVKTLLCKGQVTTVQKYQTLRTYWRQDCTQVLHRYCKEMNSKLSI